MSRLLALMFLTLAASAHAAKDGELDTLYGGAELGRVRVPFDVGGDLADHLLAARALDDGRTVAVGVARSSGLAYNRIGVAVRLPSGMPDTSVAPNGRYVLTVPGSNVTFTYFDAAAIAPDGSFYAIGHSGTDALAVWHYDLGGALLGGPFTLGEAGRHYQADRAMVLANGRLQIGARSRPAASGAENDYDATLVRMLPSGAPDTLFGGDGSVTVAFDPVERDDAWALAEVGDTTIVVCSRVGNLVVGNKQRYGIAQVRRDGTLEQHFNGTGMVVDQWFLNGTEADMACHDVGVVNTGTVIRFLVAGRACTPGLCQAYVVPYESDGQLIANFGSGGIRLVGFGNVGGFAAGFPLIETGTQPHDIGRIYLAEYDGTDKLQVTRLNSLGADDASFGTTGAVTSIQMSYPAIGGTPRKVIPFAMTMGPTGLQIAGDIDLDDGNSDFALFRLLGNTMLRDGFE